MNQYVTRNFIPQLRQSYSDAGVIFFSFCIAIVVFISLFPVFPGVGSFEIGMVVDKDIMSPKTISYPSEVITEKLRDERASEVSSQLVLDTDIRGDQLLKLDTVLTAIGSIRTDDQLSSSAKETAIRNVSGVILSNRVAASIVEVNDSQWRALQDESKNILGRILAEAIGEDEVPDARNGLSGLLSPLLTADHVLIVREVVAPLVVPTLKIDEERTETLRNEVRANTQTVYQNFARGELIVTAGSILAMEDLEAIDQLDLMPVGIDYSKVIAVTLISIFNGLIFAGYLTVFRPSGVQSLRQMFLFGFLYVLAIVIAKLALPFFVPDVDRHFLIHILPLAAGPIAIAVLLDLATAIIATLLITVVVVFIQVYLPGSEMLGVASPLQVAQLASATIVSSLAGIFIATRADRIQRFLTAGFAACGGSLLGILPFWLIDPDKGYTDLIWIAGATLLGGLLTALLVVGAFILLSRPFGIITRVELMELAQLSRPLLRRLQDEAPGTFQHSILVGNLAERAADRIGADSLLARVGAYYHDIGKLGSPSFFAENNANEESPHEGLDPLQSTRVILQHVTGGVETARRNGLPEVLIQFIEQHHGTRLVAYFYRRAVELNSDIDQSLFRYPGPKPQSREVVLVMLADSCEAATRASSDRSSARIREIVTEAFRERIDENEFEESPISLSDLSIVRESYISTLEAVYHPRVEYPEPSVQELEARGRNNKNSE
ncbi:MAG: HDIG domain-containing protein [Dehalococcoidia bacterium]|nr:HDIG domain-containing protein [Dehalococcoidia bacterium]